jgi:hypothetical protein
MPRPQRPVHDCWAGAGPRPRRIVLETDRATLEWLVPEEQVQRAMGVTRPGVRSTGSTLTGTPTYDPVDQGPATRDG